MLFERNLALHCSFSPHRAGLTPRINLNTWFGDEFRRPIAASPSWHGSRDKATWTTAAVPFRGSVGKRAAAIATRLMNTHPNYTLASQPQTGRFLRARVVMMRGTFAASIFLTDIAFIIAMSCLTGIAYHLVAYGEPGNIALFLQVGVVAASIFAVSNLFRSEYRLPNFCTFKPNNPALERHADLPVDGRLPGANLGRLFTRVGRTFLCHHAVRAPGPALLRCAHHDAGEVRRPYFRATDFPDRHRRAGQCLHQPLYAVGARHRYRRLPLHHTRCGHRIRAGAHGSTRSRLCRGGCERAQPVSRRRVPVNAVVRDRNHPALCRYLPGATGRNSHRAGADPL